MISASFFSAVIFFMSKIELTDTQIGFTDDKTIFIEVIQDGQKLTLEMDKDSAIELVDGIIEALDMLVDYLDDEPSNDLLA